MYNKRLNIIQEFLCSFSRTRMEDKDTKKGDTPLPWLHNQHHLFQIIAAIWQSMGRQKHQEISTTPVAQRLQTLLTAFTCTSLEGGRSHASFCSAFPQLNFEHFEVQLPVLQLLLRSWATYWTVSTPSCILASQNPVISIVK